MIGEPPCDIEASVTFLSPTEGGRKSPVASGYIAQFYYDGHDWDAMHRYAERKQVLPGETVTACLTFVSPTYQVGRLYPGKLFLVREGVKTIAQGQVTGIIDLVESAKRIAQDNNTRYFKRHWPDNRDDEYADWGGAIYYFACHSNGNPEQQIEVYDNGLVLIYDEVYSHDQYGMLSNQPLDPQEFASDEISSDEFWHALSSMRPYNRGQE